MQKISTSRLPGTFLRFDLPRDFPCVGGGVHEQGDRPITFLHVHNCLEIGYCHEGSGIFVVQDKVMPFARGDVSVITPDEFHLAQSAAGTVSRWTWVLLDPARLLAAAAPEGATLSTDRYGGPAFRNVIPAREEPELSELGRLLAMELSERKSGYRSAVRALVWAFMTALARRPAARVAPGRARKRRDALSLVAPALEHLAQRYGDDLAVDDLAALCHTSAATLWRHFRAATGLSPHQYLTRVRVHMAAALLGGTSRGVLDISLEVGFPSVSSLNRHFRQTFGVSPREWRRGAPAAARRGNGS